MLTQLDDMTLIRYGIRFRTGYLVEQARYTLKLALSEDPPLDLPAGYLARIEQMIARVEGTHDDREVAEVESRLARERQDLLYRESKMWRRRMVARTHRAARMGANIPKELLTVGRADTVPKLLESMATTLRLVGEFASELSCVGNNAPLVEQGKKLFEDLASADADQEHKRLVALPASVQGLYRDRGELYIGLKIINDAGREQHFDDPPRASRYSMLILHRRGTGPAAKTEAMPVEPS